MTFLLSVALNWADELWHPVGAAWLAVRIAVSALFAVALIACIGLWAVRKRKPESRGNADAGPDQSPVRLMRSRNRR